MIRSDTTSGGDTNCSSNFLSCDHPPDACTTTYEGDEKESHLIIDESTKQRIKYGTANCSDYSHYYVQRDKQLIITIFVLVALLNFQEGRYVLYPFTILSTYVHEMCHGVTAVVLGGSISSLHIYKDGSGLAYTTSDGTTWKRACIASAGYMGTALIGCCLILSRRTRLGPTVGLITIGVCILLSCLFLVRNTFGLLSLSLIGVVLIVCGWKLPASYVRYLYNFVAITCSLNAVTSIQELFQPGVGYVNGEARYSDAHTVADIVGVGTYWTYALLWLIFAIITCLIGILCAADYKPRRKNLNGGGSGSGITTTSYAPSHYTTPTITTGSRAVIPAAMAMATATAPPESYVVTQQPPTPPMAEAEMMFAPPAFNPSFDGGRNSGGIVDEVKVANITSMGFSRDAVIRALQRHNNNEEYALNELLSAV